MLQKTSIILSLVLCSTLANAATFDFTVSQKIGQTHKSTAEHSVDLARLAGEHAGLKGTVSLCQLGEENGERHLAVGFSPRGAAEPTRLYISVSGDLTQTVLYLEKGADDAALEPAKLVTSALLLTLDAGASSQPELVPSPYGIRRLKWQKDTFLLDGLAAKWGSGIELTASEGALERDANGVTTGIKMADTWKAGALEGQLNLTLSRVEGDGDCARASWTAVTDGGVAIGWPTVQDEHRAIARIEAARRNELAIAEVAPLLSAKARAQNAGAMVLDILKARSDQIPVLKVWLEEALRARRYNDVIFGTTVLSGLGQADTNAYAISIATLPDLAPATQAQLLRTLILMRNASPVVTAELLKVAEDTHRPMVARDAAILVAGAWASREQASLPLVSAALLRLAKESLAAPESSIAMSCIGAISNLERPDPALDILKLHPRKDIAEAAKKLSLNTPDKGTSMPR